MALDKKEKIESPSTPADKLKRFLDIYLCTFRTAGRRCQMLGGHVDHGSDHRLCTWHWLNQATPDMLQNHEEFIRFREVDREGYPKEWLHASLYVDDDIVWDCILGKEQRKEFVRALRVVEKEIDGKKGEDILDPPTPEVSIKEYADSLPF